MKTHVLLAWKTRTHICLRAALFASPGETRGKIKSVIPQPKCNLDLCHANTHTRTHTHILTQYPAAAPAKINFEFVVILVTKWRFMEGLRNTNRFFHSDETLYLLPGVKEPDMAFE